MLPLLYLAGVIAVFIWQLNDVRAGRRSKVKALLLHAAFTLLPVALYAGVFMALVGVEEVTHRALIGEGYARTAPLVLVGGSAVGLLATLIFGLVVLVIKPRGGSGS